MKTNGMLRVSSIIFLAHSVNSFCAAMIIDDVQISPERGRTDGKKYRKGKTIEKECPLQFRSSALSA